MHNFASSFDADRFLGKTGQVIIHHNIGAQLMLLDVQDLGLHVYYIGLHNFEVPLSRILAIN
jgi:hypothetical protein